MPLHLEAVTKKQEEAFLWIVGEALQNSDDAFSTVRNGKTYFLSSSPLIDAETGQSIGKFVFTGFTNTEKMCNELIDLDIVLRSDTPALLHFDEKLAQSSDSNEYYEAVTAEEQHLIVETVDRYTVTEEIEGKDCSVFLSAFPFKLTIFKSEKDYNKSLGFKKPVKIKTGQRVFGFSKTFTCPSGALNPSENAGKDVWSFVAGTITSFREITIVFGTVRCDAYLITLRSAVGELPVLAGKEMFDTKKIAVGKIVGMQAYIKADFVKNRYPTEGVPDDE